MENNIKKALDKRILGKVLNIGTGMNYNILELVKMVEGKYKFIPPRPGESRETLADNSKAREFLCWHPEINLKKWIKQEKKHA